MKKTLSTLGLLVFICSLYAQSVQVFNANTRQALDVTATGKSSGITFISDPNGHLDLSKFTRDDSVVIQHLGFENTTISVKGEANRVIYLNPASFDLQTVVISESRFDENRRESLRQVAVISKNEIEDKPNPTTADVLQNSGQVFVQKSQAGGGSPNLRGFEASRILLSIDGIRMNNAIYRAGHLQNIITTDPQSLEKVEVLYGPGSVIYGSDALGGVVSLITLQPKLSSSDKASVKGNFSANYQSANNGYRFHGDINFGMKKAAVLFSATYNHFGDLRQGNTRNPLYGDWGKRPEYVTQNSQGVDTLVKNNDPNLQKFTGYNQIDVMGKILYQPKDGRKHILNIQYSTTTDIPRYDRLTQYRNGSLRYAEWYYGPQDRLLIAYQNDLKLNKKIATAMKTSLAFQNIVESRHSRSFGSSKLNNQSETVKIASLNLDFIKQINKSQINYGFEYFYNHVKSIGETEDIESGEVVTSDSRYPDGGSQVHTAGLYLAHSYRFNDVFKLSEGIRYSFYYLESKFNDKSFFPFPYDKAYQRNHSLNGNIGLTITPEPGWVGKILLSSGVRNPNVDDLSKVFESIPGSIIIPNPDLKPEYTYNAEVSLGKQIGKKVWLNAGTNFTYFRNAIVTSKASFNGQDSIYYDGQYSQVLSNQNKRKAYLYGAFAEIDAQLFKWLRFTSNITYTYGRVITDSTHFPLDHIPPVFGKTAVEFKHKGFRGEFWVNYNGWKKLDDYNLEGEDNLSTALPQGNPAWFTLNASVTYRLHKNVSAELSLENILDSYYRVFASGVSAPGRNLSLSLKANF